ncbi:MAG: hypothetical protein LBI48_00625 [Burkholderiaceae bacterium]|jgi:plasmid maintenance system antidote protein VapI|nr:hypothetical protein [Burkholderiaceae bacterium]
MGKDNSAPAPDPALVAAQVHSLGIQDDAISRMMAMSEDLAPLQRTQLQQAIDQSGQLWTQSQEDRQFALGQRDKLAGIQDRIVQDAQRFNTEDEANKLAAQATGDVNQQFSNAADQQTRALQRTGVNPNDGRYAAMGSQMAAAQGLALAGAAGKARDTARQEGWQLTDRANNALAGYPAMTMQGQTAGLNTMGAGMGAVNAGVGGMLSPFQAIGSAAGQMGSNATSMYGTQANAYAQGQAANGAAWGGLGSAVGGIGMAIAI